MDLVSSCQDKLAYFRIKELKDVLTQLGLAKQGKKQDLVNRISMLLSDDQAVSKLHGWGKKNSIGKEVVTKIIDDTYRKMRLLGASDLATGSTSFSDLSHVKPKNEAFDQRDMKVRCPCGTSLITESMIKCEDPRCPVWQHIGCVVVPEKPAEGVPPEVPPHFYCEICRINRADPFWVTMGQPLLPVKLTCNGTAGDGAMENVEKTFQLSRADTEMFQRAEFDLQIWCILLNDKIPFRMQWPQYAELQVNGCPVRATNRPGSQLLGINGRDDGSIITTLSREGSNKISFSWCDARIFCIGIRIGRRRTVQQVLSLVPKEADGERFEDAVARVRRCIAGGSTTDNADSDSDIEVVAASVTVNLRCPMSGSRIKIAGRFKPCVHMGCFDLETFVELNQRSRKWQCPICLKNYCLGNLIVDPYFNRITSLIQYCGEDVNEVDVKPDASWRAQNGGEYKDLGRWHLPNGSLCLTTDTESKPNVEVLMQVKGEGNSEGQTCLKQGIKENVNELWEVIKSENMRPPSVDHALGKFKDHIQKIMPMNSSAPGSYREGEDTTGNQEVGAQFDFSIGNGHELDSLSPSFDPFNDVQDGIPAAPMKDADVIVLSDSDDDNIMMFSPETAYDTAPGGGSGIPFPVNHPGLRYTEDTGGGTRGPLCHDLFNNNVDDLNISQWSLPTCPETVAGFQLFDIDADVPVSAVNASNCLRSGPINDYKLGSNVVFCNAPQVQDHSTNHSNTETNGILVDNPLPFGSNGTTLQIFLPSQPASVPMHANTSESSVVTYSIQPDDLLSLSLAAGGSHGDSAPSNGLNSRQQFTRKERDMDSVAKTASLLLDMSDDGANRKSSKNQNPDFFDSVPRQRRSGRQPQSERSVRRKLYMPIGTDSD